MSRYVCALDIGNTSIRAAIIDTRDRACKERVVLKTVDAAADVAALIDAFKERHAIRDTIPINCCSVCPSIHTALLRDLTGRYDPAYMRTVRFHEKLPLELRYDPPQSLGADRIANCIYGVYAFPHTNRILIDAGTAIKVDFLSDTDIFEGGFIIPGVTLQLKSLSAHTEQLPEIDASPIERFTLPGSTGEAMRHGVVSCLSGGISRLVKEIAERRGCSCVVLAGGGAWHFFTRHVAFDHIHVPDMTLIGTALYNEQ